MTDALLSIWTVYDHPKDHPNGFIARLWDIGPGGSQVATGHTMSGDLETIRAFMRHQGLHPIARHPTDDPVIVECWL